MLRVSVQGALEQVGLDPYLGFLHGIRPGKPALALDLMEEMRPLLVDRLVLTLVNRGQLVDRHTKTLPGGAVQLTDDGRKFFLEHWSAARSRTWHHAALDQDIPAALLPLSKPACSPGIYAATRTPTFHGRSPDGTPRDVRRRDHHAGR
jgi:CRISPR-associated protein Cas1